ncbi:MAG: ATP-binding protein, partial [Caldilineaceae bacterium]
GLADNRTLIAGINGDPLAIAAIAAGTMHATVESNPQELGRNLADHALLAARSHPLPDHFNYTLELVTAANVSQVAARKLVAIAELPSRLVDVNRQQEDERVRQLRASLEMNRSLGAIVDWQDLSKTLVEIIRSRYGYDRVRLFQWSATDQALLLMTDVPHPASGAAHVAVSVAAAEANLLAVALLRNQSVYLPDAQSSLRFRPDAAWPATRARIVLPIRFADRTIGVLDLHSDQPAVRSQAELDALQALADQLGSAIQNSRLYESARAATTKAEESNRARTRLLANLSYGLRSPLNVILGYVQSALAEPNPYGVALPGALREDLQTIAQSGADLTRLVGELLDLAQAESGPLPLYPEEIDLLNLLTDLFRSAERVMGGRHDVSWQLQLPGTLPTCSVDPVRLRSVLMTLLSNAARFTPVGAIRLGAAAEENQVHIWVEDTGIGIAPDRLALLQAASGGDQHGGAGAAPIGLGLGIASHLVGLMGGLLTLSSHPGEGTLVRLMLPRSGPAIAHQGEEIGAKQADAVQLPNTVPETEAGTSTPYRLALGRATRLVKLGVEYIESHYDDVTFSRDALAQVLNIS